MTYLSASTASRAVPVSLRITEALANGDRLVAELSDGRQHVVGEVVNCLVVDIVTDGQPLRRGSRSTVGSDVALEVVLGVLDLVDIILVVIVGVNIEVGNVVAKIGQVLLATRLSCAAGVRRAHVCGDLANDVAKSHLVLPHLLLAVSGGDSAQVQVGPGVRCDLVTLSVHALNSSGVFGGDVDLALVDVVASDEESGLSAVGLEDIHDVLGVLLLWAIVIGQSNCARGDTVVDTSATVFDVADLSTGNGRSVGTTWGYVLRAARAVLVVTSRGVAVVILGTAVCKLLVSQQLRMSMVQSYIQHRSSTVLLRSCQHQHHTGGHPGGQPNGSHVREQS